MNIEQIGRKALTILKLKFGIPNTGFITGGSISNLMWEIVSHNKSVINDIDVFVLHDMIVGKHKKNPIFTYKNIDDAYTQIENQTFIIRESVNDGIFNWIRFESKNNSPQIIIDSFDINCTQVGYSIDEDKFYWTENFTEFLQTGKLKIVNLNTPAHSAIRIVKKSKELKAELNDCELNLCQYANTNYRSFIDSKINFKQRFADTYESYSDILNNFFILKRDLKLEKFLRGKGIFDNMYYLQSTSNEFNFKNTIFENSLDSSNHITTSEEFLFYIRNIYGNTYLNKIWNKLYPLYTKIEYIDCNVDCVDTDYLLSIIHTHPKCIDNLKGLTLSKQVEMVIKIMDNITKYHNRETAIAVLENIKINKDWILDEDECLILGLSVRKKVGNYSEDWHLFNS